MKFSLGFDEDSWMIGAELDCSSFLYSVLYG